MKIEDIAKVAHEVNRAYCIAIGDDSQPAWDDAPLWQKESAMVGVMFHCDNPDATPEGSHGNWMLHKINDGWKWGPVKDLEKKEHPCLVTYNSLPVEQRVKDYLFAAVCKSLLGE